MNFKDLTDSVGNALYRQVGRASSQFQRQRSLPVDVLENEEAYLVVFDAPGVDPENVQVRYVDGTVKIRLDRFREFHEGFEMRFPGRSMSLEGETELPDDALVNATDGTARLGEYGSLRIEIPKETAIETDADTETDQITIDD